MPQTAPAQRRLWFLHRLAADRAGYVHVAGYLLDGPLDVAALRVALTAVVCGTALGRRCRPTTAPRPACGYPIRWQR
jgi:hypothetical protein